MADKGEVWVARVSMSDKEKGLGQGDLMSNKGENDKTIKPNEIKHVRGWRLEWT